MTYNVEHNQISPLQVTKQGKHPKIFSVTQFSFLEIHVELLYDHLEIFLFSISARVNNNN